MGRVGVALGRGLRRRVGDLPTAFWWLWSGTLVNRFGYFVQPFLLLYLVSERGLSTPQAGLALTALGAGSLVSQPIGGVLSDRLGPARALVVGLVLSAASVFGLGSIRSLLGIVLITGLTGCCLDLYRPASQALVAEMIGVRQRPRAYALLYWAVNLGYTAGISTAGFLAAIDYRLLFLADAGTSLGFAALVARGLRVYRPHTAPAQPASSSNTRGAVNDRMLWGLSAVTLVYAMVYLQVGVTLPLAVIAAGLSTATFGLIIALNGLLIVVVTPLSVPLIDRLDRGRVLIGAFLLVGSGFALTGWCQNVWQFSGSVVVWTLGEIAAAGTLTAFVTELAPAHLRGRYLGFAGSAWGGAALLAPLVGTGLFAVAPTGLWIGCLGAGIACAAAQHQLNRRLPASSI
jgi:MFS family permease